MKQVSIRNIVIPSRSRSGNYPTGSTVIPGGGGSNATIDLSKYMKLALWLENFEAKTDTDGNQYIYAKKPLVSVGGFTAYCSDETHVPSIFEGIPIDNDTIYWDESTGVRILKAKGSGGGSDFDATAMWAALSAATDEQINKSHLTDAFNGYATESWVEGKGYALQTSLDAVSTKLNDFLEGSDTDTIINKWKELEAFLAGMSETDNLAEILSTKADKSYVDTELTKYVTLATEQTIDGLKHFTNGLTIGATKHKIYEKDGNILIEGNVLVTGGITAYSTGEEGGGSSGGLDVNLLWEILGGTGTQQINKTHLTNALSGYATESWVTSQNYLTSVNWSQVLNKPTTLGGYGITDAYTKTESDNRFVNVTGDTITGDLFIQKIAIVASSEINSADRLYLAYQDTPQGINVCHNNTPFTYGSANHTIWHAGNDGVGSGLDADLLDGYHEEQFFRETRFGTSDTNDTRLFSLNGSAVDTSSTDWNGSFFGLHCNTSNSGLVFNLLGFGGDLTEGKIKVNYSIDSNRWGSEWRTLAFTEGNVYSATKLQTPRTIWGQSFDGTRNVSGNMTGIGSISASNGSYSISNDATNPYLRLIAGGVTGYVQVLNDGRFVIGQSTTTNNNITINTNGNVGIGETSPSQKLYVNGNININGYLLPLVNNKGIYIRNQATWHSGIGYDTTNNECMAFGVQNVNTKFKFKVGFDWSTFIGGGSYSNMSNADLEIGAGYVSMSLGYSSQTLRFENSNEINCYQGMLYLNHRGSGGSLGSTSHIVMCVNGGNVGIGTLAPSAKLHVAGDILSTGGITCYSSDQRAKTVIEQINLSLKQIANAPTIRFKWNGWKIKYDGKVHVGGIAQYMQAVLPETVLEADGMLNLDYATTGYVFAVQTAKHLVKTDTEVERLKKRVKRLEKQLKQLGYEEANIMDD